MCIWQKNERERKKKEKYPPSDCRLQAGTPNERTTPQMGFSLAYPDYILSESLSRKNQPSTYKERR